MVEGVKDYKTELKKVFCSRSWTIFSIVTKHNFWSFIFCRRRDKGILPNVLHHIGGTPLIKINKISAAAGLECELRKFDLLKVLMCNVY
jgi:hypothetical protein